MNASIPLVAAALLAQAACVFQGPAGISEDHRSFVDAAGKLCFWLGDTEWELFRAFTEEEAKTILEDRHRKGFNAIQVMILGVKGVKLANVHGEKPFGNDDPATPNEAYFKAIDAIVRIAEANQITLVVGLYHKSADYSKAITPANARKWAAWVGRRYASAPNVMWSMYPEAKNSYLPIVRELAAGVAEGDGGRHLITVHPDPSPASSSWIHEEPWLSFNTLQSFQSNHLNYRMVAADRARTPAKPVLNGEARYEDEGGTTPLMVRRGAWWSCLAGGFYSYGHGGNWMKPADWAKWLDSPASRQMKVMGDFFRSLDWWTLVPDQALISGTAGELAAARSAKRDWAIVYLPAGGSVTVDDKALSGKPRVSWLNPADGTLQAAAGTSTFSAPEGWPDAVLVLDARSK